MDSLFERGHVRATAGNISVRLNESQKGGGYLEELEETAQLIILSASAPAPLTETQIDELRRAFGARW
jgi:ribulose-5-phosphate 4-epimerase/fuculose-1-phosphate aldolase